MGSTFTFHNLVLPVIAQIVSFTLSVFVIILLVHITKFFSLKNKLMSKALEAKDTPDHKDNPQ